MISLAPWLEHLRSHLPVARAGEDPEGPHQLRVASRYLAVRLKLAGLEILQADLRWLRRAAGDVRDLDVLLGGRLPAVWASWLTKQRTDARARLLAALDAPRLDGLTQALELVLPLPPGAARKRVARLAKRALGRGRDAEDAPEDLEALHGLRRAARGLRYGLEWLGEEAPDLKDLQQALGRLSDPAVALRWLDAFPGRRRIAAERRRILGALGVARRESLDAWKAARKHVAALV